MDATRWDQIEILFERALALSPEQRAALLREASRTDAALRAEVEQLLTAYEEAGPYFDDLAAGLFTPPSEAEHQSESRPDPYRLLGQTVSHYKVLEWLGGGGMGVVYKAEDTRLGRMVALKFLPPEWNRDAEAKRRFTHEAQAASALDHPNICTIYEIDETAQGQLFIAMAYYGGETLKQKIARGPLPVKEALSYAVQIARGLASAHAQQIVHRDVKPANVMVTRTGVVKIVDFGLAKMADLGLTKTGTRLGTPAYMSPEQVRGEAVDGRTDIWSLGVVLHEMLTGTVPFRGAYEQALLYSILHDQPASMPGSDREVPPELLAVISRCLQKESASRYQTATGLLGDLVRVVQQTGTGRAAPQHTAISRVLKFPRPLPGKTVGFGALIGVLLLVSLLLLSLPSFLGWLGAEHQAEGVIQQREKIMAVLPCAEVTHDPSDRALCDGLAEMLTNKLTPLQHEMGIWVVPASEMRKSRGEVAIARDAWREFGANRAVALSIQREGGRILVTSRLIDAETFSGQLDARVIEVPVNGALQLQDRLVLEVAQMLNVELQAQRLRADDTHVPGAYLSFLTGRGYLWRSEEAENVDTALQLLQQAVDEDPAYTMAYAGLGEAYLYKYEAGKDAAWITQALENAERAVELNSQLAPAYVILGRVYTQADQDEEAVQAFQQAIALDPLDAAAYSGLAGVYEEQGRLAEAEATYVKAAEVLPAYWICYYDLGLFYYYQRRYEEAVAPWRHVVELVPDEPFGYNNLGALYSQLGRPAEAFEMYKRSIEIEKNYRAFSNLGTLYHYHEHYSNAVQMYLDALKIDPLDYRVRGNLASSYYWAGERDKAQAEYQHAIAGAEEDRKEHPDNLDVLSRLATYYAMVGERMKATDLVEQVIRAAPQDAFVAFRIGHTWEQLDEREKALFWIDRALAHGLPWMYVEGDPGLRLLRADEGFQRLQEKYGLHFERSDVG